MAEHQTDAYRDTSHPIYQELQSSEEFARLRSRYRGFAFPWTIAFLAWYLLYVVMSNWAGGFMDTKVVGHINVALVFGLLQFATTFALAWFYARHSRTHLDPLARELADRFDKKEADR